MSYPEESRDNSDDKLKEVERCLSAAYRSLQRRDYITPSSEELIQIQTALLRVQCSCPKNLNDFFLSPARYVQNISTADIEIVISAMPDGTSNSHRGALIKIATRRIVDPEHLQLSLSKFPWILRDQGGREFLPHHRESGSLYFYGLQSEQCYTFRVRETL